MTTKTIKVLKGGVRETPEAEMLTEIPLEHKTFSNLAKVTESVVLGWVDEWKISKEAAHAVDVRKFNGGK